REPVSVSASVRLRRATANTEVVDRSIDGRPERSAAVVIRSAPATKAKASAGWPFSAVQRKTWRSARNADGKLEMLRRWMSYPEKLSRWVRPNASSVARANPDQTWLLAWSAVSPSVNLGGGKPSMAMSLVV